LQTDSVHFSIDGYNDSSNNLYRKNSNWDSIINGIVALRASSNCTIVWAAIAFKFNEDKIDSMRLYAQSIGADVFQLTKSTKFGCVYPSYGLDDPLQPSIKFVSSTHRFERAFENLSTRQVNNTPCDKNVQLFNQRKAYNDITPLCEIGNKGLYIDSQGRLFPCCWVANRYSHNSEWRSIANKFNLDARTLSDALLDPFWETEFRSFTWSECKTKCATSLVNFDYGTTW
jgi:MoaA/NifB/PqqE/SkfB family radical SAM enzyme